jgi:hypothetical protein
MRRYRLEVSDGNHRQWMSWETDQFETMEIRQAMVVDRLAFLEEALERSIQAAEFDELIPPMEDYL